jgi:dTMP kinase
MAPREQGENDEHSVEASVPPRSSWSKFVAAIPAGDILPLQNTARVFDKAKRMSQARITMPLITFEGSEGCGKSTQVRRLERRLQNLGIATSVFREPGGTGIGEAIRHLLQHSEENRAMKPEAELLLFEASRSQLVREKIQPALARGDFVLCDRFFDSTTIYQGAARSLDAALVNTLNDFAIADCIPDLTFVIDIDRATARARLGNRKLRDRMEDEPEEFHARVINAYRELAQRDPKRIILIDGRNSADAVEDQIWRAVSTCFSRLSNQQSANASPARTSNQHS